MTKGIGNRRRGGVLIRTPLFVPDVTGVSAGGPNGDRPLTVNTDYRFWHSYRRVCQKHDFDDGAHDPESPGRWHQVDEQGHPR